MINSISPSATSSCDALLAALDGYPFIIRSTIIALLSMVSGWFMRSILFLFILNYFRDFELCVNVGDKLMVGETILTRKKA